MVIILRNFIRLTLPKTLYLTVMAPVLPELAPL